MNVQVFVTWGYMYIMYSYTRSMQQTSGQLSNGLSGIIAFPWSQQMRNAVLFCRTVGPAGASGLPAQFYISCHNSYIPQSTTRISTSNSWTWTGQSKPQHPQETLYISASREVVPKIGPPSGCGPGPRPQSLVLRDSPEHTGLRCVQGNKDKWPVEGSST